MKVFSFLLFFNSLAVLFFLGGKDSVYHLGTSFERVSPVGGNCFRLPFYLAVEDLRKQVP